MKHNITVAICITIILCLGVLAWDVSRDDAVRAQISAKQTAVTQAITAKLRAKAVADEKARLDAECTKAETYYSQLTTKQKAATEAPNCRLDIVQ